MPAKLHPKVAEAMMLKVGLKPLEPYKSALTKWKCLCLNCENIVHPKLNGIQQGRGGCITCGLRNRRIPHKLSSEEAVKRMNNSDLQPLEPYRSSAEPWKCQCLNCGDLVSPTLGDVSSGQGGCIKCGRLKASNKNTIPSAEAAKMLLDYGYEPLVKYISSHTRWKSKCLKCSRIVHPRLSLLKSGHGGCGHCSNRIADLEEINRLFKKNKLKSLQSKPLRMKDGWSCQCLRCDREIKVYVTNLYRGSDPCKYCSGKAVDPESAGALMKKAKLQVLAPYVSQRTKWKSRCLKCKKIVYPQYASVRNGQGGCMYCAEKGMDMNVQSYLYLIKHESYGALKIGIGNEKNNQSNDRLFVHKRNNWSLIKKWQFKTGAQAYEVEQDVLTTLRLDLGIPQYLSKHQMPQRGETETLDLEFMSELELEKIIKKAIRSKSRG